MLLLLQAHLPLPVLANRPFEHRFKNSLFLDIMPIIGGAFLAYAVPLLHLFCMSLLFRSPLWCAHEMLGPDSSNCGLSGDSCSLELIVE